MNKALLCMLLLGSQAAFGQGLYRITGFLGLYHTSPGYIYSDTLGTDSVLMQDAFQFGEMNVPSQLIDNGFPFKQDIDSCVSWKSNKITGMIQPVSEGGKVSQPNDTMLYNPFDISQKPGMIQAGARFSRLSQQLGPVCGVIIDDWDGDTAVTRLIKEAVQGKDLDLNGNIISGSQAITPSNTVTAVVYYTWMEPFLLPYIDGVSYWLVDSQNCCYANIDRDISQLVNNFPHKEISIGIYLKNSHLGWTNPESVQYMLQHALNRYDQGEINGITLFAGPYLTKQSMPLSQWKAFALPHWLDSLYYPYLGEASASLVDCNMHLPLKDAFVRVYCKSRTTGERLLRSRQKTDSLGNCQFGLWAGNRNNDSTYYWIVAGKEGYDPDSVGFWVKRQQHTAIPDLPLCLTVVHEVKPINDQIIVYPNPANTTLYLISPIQNGELEITDLVGKVRLTHKVMSSTMNLDVSGLKGGYYVVKLKSIDGKVAVKGFVKE